MRNTKSQGNLDSLYSRQYQASAGSICQHIPSKAWCCSPQDLCFSLADSKLARSPAGGWSSLLRDTTIFECFLHFILFALWINVVATSMTCLISWCPFYNGLCKEHHHHWGFLLWRESVRQSRGVGIGFGSWKSGEQKTHIHRSRISILPLRLPYIGAQSPETSKYQVASFSIGYISYIPIFHCYRWFEYTLHPTFVFLTGEIPVFLMHILEQPGTCLTRPSRTWLSYWDLQESGRAENCRGGHKGHLELVETSKLRMVFGISLESVGIINPWAQTRPIALW